MIRWNVKLHPSGATGMESHPEGYWVAAEDAMAAINVLEAKVAKLKVVLELHHGMALRVNATSIHSERLYRESMQDA